MLTNTGCHKSSICKKHNYLQRTIKQSKLIPLMMPTFQMLGSTLSRAYHYIVSLGNESNTYIHIGIYDNQNLKVLIC